MTTIPVDVTGAPSTFLNLKLGVAYAPRVPTPGFVAYMLVEEAAGELLNGGGVFNFKLYAYDGTGGGALLLETEDAGEAFHKFAVHLGY